MAQPAVDEASQYIRNTIKKVKEAQSRDNEKLLGKIEQLKKKHIDQTIGKIDTEKGLRQAQQKKLKDSLKRIESVFDNHKNWVTETQIAESGEKPYVKIVAVLRGRHAD